MQTEWLVWAEELQLRQDSLFQDEQGGGYFCSDPKDDTILLQLKEGERTPDDEEERSTLGSELISLLLIF